MSYPAPFHRLVLIGTLFNDIFNTSLSIIPRSGTGIIGLPPAADVLPAVAAIFQSRWSTGGAGGGLGVHVNARLTSVKLNAIGTDGRYADDDTNEHIYTTPIPGGGSFNVPPQLATVVTLRTSAERGRASKGRMFLPVCEGFQLIETDGRAQASTATRVATATRTIFNEINAAYAAQVSGDEAIGRVGVASSIGAGTFREVTRVTVGRVTDTVRSRRNRQIEDPEEALLTP